MTTVDDLIKSLTRKFEEKELSSPRLDAELIIGSVLKKSREELILAHNKEVAQEDEREILHFAQRRSAGEPVAYLLGKKSFFGLDFAVKRGILIPRPETEHLVEEVLQWLAVQKQENFTICDLGCGSGCIGLSILHNSMNSTLSAVDSSEIACEVTRDNAERLGLKERVTVINAAVESLQLSKFDIVVANPPYVTPDDRDLSPEVREFEPPEALFSGTTGLEHIINWKNAAAGLLRAGGLLVMEFGSKQGSQVLSIFESDPAYQFARIGKDLSGHDRYLITTRV